MDQGTALADVDVVGLLSSWKRLNDDLLQLSEAAVRQLLVYELTHQRRKLWISRLHHRFNKMRFMRERIAISYNDVSWL